MPNRILYQNNYFWILLPAQYLGRIFSHPRNRFSLPVHPWEQPNNNCMPQVRIGVMTATYSRSLFGKSTVEWLPTTASTNCTPFYLIYNIFWCNSCFQYYQDSRCISECFTECLCRIIVCSSSTKICSCKL